MSTILGARIRSARFDSNVERYRHLCSFLRITLWSHCISSYNVEQGSMPVEQMYHPHYFISDLQRILFEEHCSRHGAAAEPIQWIYVATPKCKPPNSTTTARTSTQRSSLTAYTIHMPNSASICLHTDKNCFCGRICIVPTGPLEPLLFALVAEAAIDPALTLYHSVWLVLKRVDLETPRCRQFVSTLHWSSMAAERV